MEFYCCDCQLIFDAQPDGSGYEQAPCPQCQQISMTSAFEGKSTAETSPRSRMVVVAEFIDEAAAEPMVDKLEREGIPVQINLPDVGGDFLTGGSDNVSLLVPSELAPRARQMIQDQ